MRSAPHWPSWLAQVPSLVAESLAVVQDPLAQWLRAPPAAAAEAVAAALARALLPPATTEEPPAWLRHDQRLSFARALAAARRYGGALLADGVGTGKTFIGLAVAAALEPGRPIQVLAPAALLPQWREAARRVELEICLHSHETLSRGRLPEAAPGAVLIDESHRFRNPSTRRYRTLAPWCVGRRGLLLSATPAVNRLEDLSHQLLLFARDDALGWAGTASLRGLEPGAAALAELVITGEDRSAALPEQLAREIRPLELPGSPFESLRRALMELGLSRDRATAGLLRGSLLAALASSPLALADALGRYGSLLQHARDAAATGRVISRQAIRRVVGAEGDQLVLWPLVAEAGQSAELVLEDLEAVQSLRASARAWPAGADAKLLALRQLLSDPRPTLVFTMATATVRYLRRQLSRGVAWCTGAASGLDTSTVPREAVIDWFRAPVLPGDTVLPRPKLLIATDVAAEGLDLPLLQRVIHYDLPWTAVRLEQRNGRAQRLGSRHRSVEVIRFLPAPILEAALRQTEILESKSGLPDRLGLGRGTDAPWRLRARVAERWRQITAKEGIALVTGDAAGVVTGFRVTMADGTLRTVVRAQSGAGWSGDAALIAGLLDAAHGVTLIRAPGPRTLRALLRTLALQVRTTLRGIQGERLAVVSHSPAERRALRRVMVAARQAARARDRAQLALLETGLRLLRRGRTAGETHLVETWGELPLREVLAGCAELPAEPGRPEVAGVELVGILVVEPTVPRR